MKTKFYWVALLASAAMIAQAKAGGHYGGGGGPAMAAHPAPAHAAAPAFQPAARGNFGGGRYIAPGAHVSSYYGPTTFRQQRLVHLRHGILSVRLLVSVRLCLRLLRVRLLSVDYDAGVYEGDAADY